MTTTTPNQQPRAIPNQQPHAATLTALVAVYRYATGLATTRPNFPYSWHLLTDGNMNLVARISIKEGTWVIKHGDPWVRRYPKISAPARRTAHEAKFYDYFAQAPSLQGWMPSKLGYQASENLLALSWVEHQQTGMSLYGQDSRLATSSGLSPELWQQALTYLSILHRLPTPPRWDHANSELRALNHQHIFNYPFDPTLQENLESICKGLSTVAAPYQQDTPLKQRFRDLGAVYLQERTAPDGCAIHGDFYPGSWLLNPEGLIVIDPEFSFQGPCEFDLGILLAHHLLLGGKEDAITPTIATYKSLRDDKAALDPSLVLGFCGCEIIRRLLGVAQLPIAGGLAKRRTLLAIGRDLCLS